MAWPITAFIALSTSGLFMVTSKMGWPALSTAKPSYSGYSKILNVPDD